MARLLGGLSAVETGVMQALWKHTESSHNTPLREATARMAAVMNSVDWSSAERLDGRSSD
jgi:hypothetical protein